MDHATRAKESKSTFEPIHPVPGSGADSIFNSRVFDLEVQEVLLPKKIFLHLDEVRSGKIKFDVSYADLIAETLMLWATEHGANHYMHWFQPLRGAYAEKHDSFLSWDSGHVAIEKFSGKDLLQGESDASSLPSGGLRRTHQARGYTSWDPASFPFLMEAADGLTLCVPALFYSWTGAALDHKIPLLRSDQKLSAVANRLLSLCKMDPSQVYATLGAEQEYFLIERALYAMRPDLVICGRTLFGARPSKGQELEDHYFSPVSERAMLFMREFEEAAR